MRRARPLVALAVAAAVIVVRPVSTISAAADYAPVGPERADQIITSSTVQLLAFGCNLAMREATGVVVGPHQILTNQHVVAGSRLVDVVADGQSTSVGSEVRQATVGDVAALTSPGLALPAIPFATADPAPGSDVRLAGYPTVGHGQRQPGLVVGTARVVDYQPGKAFEQPWPVMRLSTPARPGMSGGPVLDAAGHLAGVVFGNEVPTGQALAIPASALRQLIDGGWFVPSQC